MRGNLNKLKKVIDADTYATGGILQRAQNVAVSKDEGERLGDMVTVERCKKHTHGYGRR
jgi:hypothetical protein